MALTTGYEHIVLGEDGVPLIRGTTMKVVELVMEKTAYGWSAEEIHFQHPYLSLGQIYSALAYYSDHKDELDRDIERREHLVREIRTSSREPAGARDLFLNKVMTIEEIERVYDSEWVLLEDPVTDELTQVKSGKVLCHTKDRTELDRKLLKVRPRSSAILYIGRWVDDPNVAI